jgi:ABC-type bacteriocin/lantibiotic exporter with double-glycine peptidase domain
MQFQEFKPPSKFESFMNRYTLPILIVVVGTVLAAILLGRVWLINFNLVMIGWGIILTLITGYYVWYFIKTKKDFQEQHKNDIASMKQEVYNMKNEHLKIIESERKLFDQWQQRVNEKNKQDAERFEKQIGEQQLTIEGIKQQLDALQNRLPIWSMGLHATLKIIPESSRRL